MRTFNAAVQERSVSHPERCLANREDLARIGRAIGQQVRLVRSTGAVALYTIAPPALDEPGTVGMGSGGRKRLRGPAEFNVTVRAEVVDQRRTDDRALADGEFVERLTVGRGRELAVIAPHGGVIEVKTDVQAAVVRDRLPTLSPWVWVCKGWGNDAFDRWHITSTDLSPESFPLLKRMMSGPFASAVSFHGFDVGRYPGADVRIGGRADETLKLTVRDAIRDRLRGTGESWDVVVARKGDRFGGSERSNVVNRLVPGSGGIQIEQSRPVRDQRFTEIAEAVASVFEKRSAREPPGHG